MEHLIESNDLRLAALMARASPRIIVPLNEDALKPGATAPSFYCVHAVTGGGITDFSDLAKEIGPGVRFFAIQAPKKLMINSDYTQLLKFIVGHYVDAIITFQPEGQIHLGGWSAGALVALEIARQLRAKGRDVGVLVSIDGGPKNTRVVGSSLRYTAKVLRNLPRALLNDDFGRLSRRLLFAIKKLLTKARPKQNNSADIHPVQGVVKQFSKYPPYQQSFMMALYDEIEGTVFPPYDGTVVVYKAGINPIRLSGVREFWKRISPNCEVVIVQATHEGLILIPKVRLLAADLKRRLIDDTWLGLERC
ncbi:MAG TPA: thioesterase domain-containing protein [Beijerinckiaceae bacterium]|nr:thioesterase domain-containing protein [Beijerinckiaceae bacterium]